MQKDQRQIKVSSDFSGNDKPGDVRKEGTDFVPFEWVSNVNFVENPNSRPIYYDKATERYMQWDEQTGWNLVDQNCPF